MGGLARRSWIINEIRRKAERFMLVDGGDALFGRSNYLSHELPAVRKKADFILESYIKMEYQAINIGFQDWAGGEDFLLNKIDTGKFPFVSANLAGKEPSTRLPPPFLVFDIKGMKVGVIGVMSNPAPFVKNYPDLLVNDPAPIIKRIENRLKGECCLLILLSNLGTKGDTELANEVEGIDIIIGSRSGLLYNPRKVKNTYLCYPDMEGKSLGRLDVTVASDGLIKLEHKILALDDSVPEDGKMRMEIEGVFGGTEN